MSWIIQVTYVDENSDIVLSSKATLTDALAYRTDFDAMFVAFENVLDAVEAKVKGTQSSSVKRLT
jgi:hypothetical protein